MKNSVRDFRFVMGAKLWGGWLDNEIVIVSANVINIHFRSVSRCGKFRRIHTTPQRLEPTRMFLVSLCVSHN